MVLLGPRGNELGRRGLNTHGGMQPLPDLRLQIREGQARNTGLPSPSFPSSLLWWLALANATWKPAIGKHRMEYVGVSLVTQSEPENGSGVWV